MERELERLTDEEEYLIPLMIELAEYIEEPPANVAQRMRFGIKRGAFIRIATLDPQRVDLVRLARFVAKKMGEAQVYGASI